MPRQATLARSTPCRGGREVALSGPLKAFGMDMSVALVTERDALSRAVERDGHLAAVDRPKGERRGDHRIRLPADETPL
jgi:hypothetical protein